MHGGAVVIPVRRGSGRITLFHFQKNKEVSAIETGDGHVIVCFSSDEGQTFGPAR